ncbi:MAG: aminopeptidase [Flavobacteriales bacterium]|nr:aminopeptidase [Flavobacteriales bacterium]|tara:strand:+ start:24 stop:944 length:921 start_codon:yes stop_codon:yes gene_type:complete
MKLLKKLCQTHSPSGEEESIKKFILQFINNNKKHWKTIPQIIEGENLQDNIILVFGKPRTAIFAHMDTIGFTVKYNNEIIKIGGPKVIEGTELVGKDKKGDIYGKIVKRKIDGIEKVFIDFHREIIRGTSLTFKVDFKENSKFIISSYLDNRLGVWNCLQLAKNLSNGIIVFSTWEEHGGGSVGYLGKYIYEHYGIKQALISDITWITSGIKHGKGCVISIRDSGIPRRKFINEIINLVEKSNIPYQLEVEDSGGSDGNELQKSSYPWDWCFIGAAEDNVHSPKEKVHKDDINSMNEIYKYLMKEL